MDFQHINTFEDYLFVNDLSSRSGYCRMNQEVVEATCQCLLAQADKAESASVSTAQLEQTVISEFSRCLMQIIGSYTSRSRGGPFIWSEICYSLICICVVNVLSKKALTLTFLFSFFRSGRHVA